MIGGIGLSAAVSLGGGWTSESQLGAVGLQSGGPGGQWSGFRRVSGAVVGEQGRWRVTWKIGFRVARRPCRPLSWGDASPGPQGFGRVRMAISPL